MDTVRFTGPGQRYRPRRVRQPPAEKIFPPGVRDAIGATVAGLAWRVVQVLYGAADKGCLSHTQRHDRGVRLAEPRACRSFRLAGLSEREQPADADEQC